MLVFEYIDLFSNRRKNLKFPQNNKDKEIIVKDYRSLKDFILAVLNLFE